MANTSCITQVELIKTLYYPIGDKNAPEIYPGDELSQLLATQSFIKIKYFLKILKDYYYGNSNYYSMDNRISQRKITTARRKSMSCKVFELKIDKSHLSAKTFKHLKQIFIEAKWFYNYCLSQQDINQANTTAKSVPVKIGERFEDRTFHALKSQMKQSIKTRLFNSLSVLSSLKKKGHRVGRLKFKSLIESVPLKQYKVTFDFNIESNRIRIQGIKAWIKVRGLEQIPPDVEIANAHLIQKCGDFYLHVTTFLEKEKQAIPKQSIGIDFGCETQLTLSNGIKIQYEVPISKRIKQLDRKIMKRNRPKSNNKRKDQLKRQKAFDKLNNKKKDIRHKIVSVLTRNYGQICFQDESVHAWQAGNHGKKIYNTSIGGIIADLKNKSHTPVVINKFFPSTQLCPQCGSLNKLELKDRIYQCSCGFIKDRDIKSAQCLLAEGIKSVPMDHREVKPEDSLASVLTVVDQLKLISGVKISYLDESGSSVALA